MGTSSLTPILAMIVVQLCFAGMNIISKLAIQSGMHPLILVSYRQIFATLSLVPFAYFLERNKVPRMTRRIGFQILLNSLTGVTGNQILYFVGLKYSTPTIVCALNNLLPAFTFILAVLFRQEYLRIKTKAGLAKALGTVLSVGGALLLSFYHGKTLGHGESKIHWSYVDKLEGTTSYSSGTGINMFLGPVAITGSALLWSVWFILQADMATVFPAPYTSSLYMCLLGSFQCVAVALCFEHNVSAWSLHSTIKLTSSLYAGIICTGLAYVVLSWTIERKGPLYVSVFSPLLLVITPVVSWALLHEKLYIGTGIGSIVIIFGLYSVLWGKSKEMKDSVQKAIEMNDLELQPYNNNNNNNNNNGSNGNHHAAAT